MRVLENVCEIIMQTSNDARESSPKKHSESQDSVSTPWGLLQQIVWTMPKAVPIIFTSLLLLGTVGGALYLFIYSAVRLAEVSKTQAEVTKQALELQSLAVKTTEDTFKSSLTNGTIIADISSQRDNLAIRNRQLAFDLTKVTDDYNTVKQNSISMQAQLALFTDQSQQISSLKSEIYKTSDERIQLATAILELSSNGTGSIGERTQKLAAQVVKESSKSLSVLMERLAAGDSPKTFDEINSLIRTLTASELEVEIEKQTAFPIAIQLTSFLEPCFLLAKPGKGESIEPAFLLKVAGRPQYGKTSSNYIYKINSIFVVKIPDYYSLERDSANVILSYKTDADEKIISVVKIGAIDSMSSTIDFYSDQPNLKVIKKAGAWTAKWYDVAAFIQENPRIKDNFSNEKRHLWNHSASLDLQVYWNSIAFKADLRGRGLPQGKLSSQCEDTLQKFIAAIGTRDFAGASIHCSAAISINDLHQLCRNLLISDGKWKILDVADFESNGVKRPNVIIQNRSDTAGQSKAEIRLDPASGQILEVVNVSILAP